MMRYALDEGDELMVHRDSSAGCPCDKGTDTVVEVHMTFVRIDDTLEVGEHVGMGCFGFFYEPVWRCWCLNVQILGGWQSNDAVITKRKKDDTLLTATVVLPQEIVLVGRCEEHRKARKDYNVCVLVAFCLRIGRKLLESGGNPFVVDLVSFYCPAWCSAKNRY